VVWEGQLVVDRPGWWQSDRLPLVRTSVIERLRLNSNVLAAGPSEAGPLWYSLCTGVNKEEVVDETANFLEVAILLIGICVQLEKQFWMVQAQQVS
jgi:hypothetical protein